MANCGYSADNKLISNAILQGKLLVINDNDDNIAILIKNKINVLISNDSTSKCEYNGHKYISHTAWIHKYRTLIKINQIRQKNMYYKPIEQ